MQPIQYYPCCPCPSVLAAPDPCDYRSISFAQKLTKALQCAGQKADLGEWRDLCTNHLYQFNEVHFSAALSSLAKGCEKRGPLSPDIADFVRRSLLPVMLPQYATFHSWALGAIPAALLRLGIEDEPLFNELGRVIMQRMEILDAHGIALCAYAFSEANYHDGPELFAALSRAFQYRAHESNTADIVFMGRGAAAARLVDASLFATLNREAHRQLMQGSVSAYDLSSLAVMFARLQYVDPALFEQLLEGLMAHVRAQTTEPLSVINCAWAFVSIGDFAPEIIHALQDLTMKCASGQILYDLSLAAWVFAASDEHIRMPCELWENLLSTIRDKTGVGTLRSNAKVGQWMHETLFYLKGWRADVWHSPVAQELHALYESNRVDNTFTEAASSRAVAAALRALAATPAGAALVGRVTTDAQHEGLRIPILCQLQQKLVAFEVTPERECAQSGRTHKDLRMLVLQGHGISLCRISERAWRQLPSFEDQQQYLARLLEFTK